MGRPSEERRTIVSAYVADRLTRERDAEGRGYVARVARATGFRGPSISTVANGKAVGDDMARAIARFWGFTSYEDMRETALKWWADSHGETPVRRGAPGAVPTGTAPAAHWPGLLAAVEAANYDPRDVGSVRVLFDGQDDVAPLTWARRLDDARRRREQGLDEAEAERARLERLSRAETPLDEVLRARPELQSVAARFDPHGPRPVVGWLEFLLEEARRETKGKRRR